MTKDTFLNAWSRELAMQSTMSEQEAKFFLHSFYSAVVGFERIAASGKEGER